MLSKSAGRALGVLAFAAGLAAIAASFTVWTLNGQVMTEFLGWLIAIGLFVAGGGLVLGIAAYFWPEDDRADAMAPSRNMARRNRRNRRSGKRRG